MSTSASTCTSQVPGLFGAKRARTMPPSSEVGIARGRAARAENHDLRVAGRDQHVRGDVEPLARARRDRQAFEIRQGVHGHQGHGLVVRALHVRRPAGAHPAVAESSEPALGAVERVLRFEGRTRVGPRARPDVGRPRGAQLEGELGGLQVAGIHARGQASGHAIERRVASGAGSCQRARQALCGARLQETESPPATAGPRGSGPRRRAHLRCPLLVPLAGGSAGIGRGAARQRQGEEQGRAHRRSA